jgi:hypothetical protein
VIDEGRAREERKLARVLELLARAIGRVDGRRARPTPLEDGEPVVAVELDAALDAAARSEISHTCQPDPSRGSHAA